MTTSTATYGHCACRDCFGAVVKPRPTAVTFCDDCAANGCDCASECRAISNLLSDLESAAVARIRELLDGRAQLEAELSVETDPTRADWLRTRIVAGRRALALHVSDVVFAN